MKFDRIATAGIAVLGAKLFGAKVPLAVGWELTHKCNHTCKYCITCNKFNNELNTNQIKKIVDSLKEMNCQVIGYTGGEALLRKDLQEIIDYTKKKGIFVMLTSNGGLIPEKINDILNVDNIQLTLDGPKKINDLQREKGMYDETIKALGVLKEHSIKTTLNCVVTKYNQDYIPKILKEAEKYGVSISFQPVAKYLKELLPNTTKYKKAINFLIDQKRKGNKHINQSISILKHISKWPNENKISCAAGIIYCRIDPEGYVAPCNMIYQDKKVDELNAAKVGFKQAFNNMPNIGCKDCWHHSRLDLNFIYNLDIPTILDVAKNQ